METLRFRSSGERHQQRLLPWSRPGERVKTVSYFVPIHPWSRPGERVKTVSYFVPIHRGAT
jgi:hypothetical protein